MAWIGNKVLKFKKEPLTKTVGTNVFRLTWSIAHLSLEVALGIPLYDVTNK